MLDQAELREEALVANSDPATSSLPCWLRILRGFNGRSINVLKSDVVCSTVAIKKEEQAFSKKHC